MGQVIAGPRLLVEFPVSWKEGEVTLPFTWGAIEISGCSEFQSPEKLDALFAGVPGPAILASCFSPAAVPPMP